MTQRARDILRYQRWMIANNPQRQFPQAVLDLLDIIEQLEEELQNLREGIDIGRQIPTLHQIYAEEREAFEEEAEADEQTSADVQASEDEQTSIQTPGETPDPYPNDLPMPEETKQPKEYSL